MIISLSLSLLALLRKQAEERKKQLEEIRRKKLEKRYGVSITTQSSTDLPAVEESETYVEYDHSGKVVRGTVVGRIGRWIKGR